MRLFLVVSLALLAACSFLETPAEDLGLRWARLVRACLPDAPATPLPQAARDSLPPPNLEADVNAQWADLARRAPGGWGGYFVDEGVPTMYLVDPFQLQVAAAFLRKEGLPIAASVVARRGRWDFAQLYDWYTYLSQSLEAGGIRWADIQEARNRIEYGVIDEATRTRMEKVLASLDVPCFLVAIDVQG